ncbi:hypothetical protein [Streptomyces sp. NBC_00019]|uniref:hypothetical protein n=1 Tax=Streptomyces sp. NBC_00019 TaxID=2975623 RepID=UPI00324C19A6
MLDPSGAAGDQDPAKLAEQASSERDTALADCASNTGCTCRIPVIAEGPVSMAAAADYRAR